MERLYFDMDYKYDAESRIDYCGALYGDIAPVIGAHEEAYRKRINNDIMKKYGTATRPTSGS